MIHAALWSLSNFNSIFYLWIDLLIELDCYLYHACKMCTIINTVNEVFHPCVWESYLLRVKGNNECTKKWYNVYITNFILTLHDRLNSFVGNSVLIHYVISSCIMWFWSFFYPRYLVWNERAEKHSLCNGKDWPLPSDVPSGEKKKKYIN